LAPKKKGRRRKGGKAGGQPEKKAGYDLIGARGGEQKANFQHIANKRGKKKDLPTFARDVKGKEGDKKSRRK